MLVPMRHSIIALNHPLPMLHCSTVFGQDGVVCSPCQSPQNDLTVSGLSASRACAAVSSKVHCFLFCITIQEVTDCTEHTAVEFDTALDLNLFPGKKFSWPCPFFFSKMRLQCHWDELKRKIWALVISWWKQISPWVVQGWKLLVAPMLVEKTCNEYTFSPITSVEIVGWHSC